jgi:predicted P-loop ATPase
MVGMSIAYDNFRDEIMYSEDAGCNWQSFKDADYTRLRIALERCGFLPPSKDATRDAVLLVAEQQAFDSAQVWLSRLTWDGVPRIERFLSTYFATDDTPYTRAVGRYIWTAMAGRVLEPGCKADMAPILVGAQGLRKSSGVAAIAPAPEFFTEISFGEKEDDLSRKMRGRLVAELGELKGLASRDSESIKAWMTKRYEDWTPKYREFNTVFPRRLLCFGTTNKDEFLVDETGHRRWLPVRVGLVDVDAITRDCAQLWAEARETWLLLGVDYHEAETLAMGEHGQYIVSDAWEPVVRAWLDTPDDMTEQKPADRNFLLVHEVLEGALRLDAKNCKKFEEMRIGAVLRALGYIRKKLRIEGVPTWVWARVDA